MKIVKNFLLAGLLLASSAWAQTPAQITALRAAIFADAPSAALLAAGDTQGLRTRLNADAGFIAWKSSVSITETGRVFNGAEWAGMTSANHTRLQTVAQYMATYRPELADVRAMFNDIWSGAGGTVTRPALLALWKRPTLRAERMLATGNGLDATPGILTWEGTISDHTTAVLVFRDNGTIWTP